LTSSNGSQSATIQSGPFRVSGTLLVRSIWTSQMQLICDLPPKHCADQVSFSSLAIEIMLRLRSLLISQHHSQVLSTRNRTAAAKKLPKGAGCFSRCDHQPGCFNEIIRSLSLQLAMPARPDRFSGHRALSNTSHRGYTTSLAGHTSLWKASFVM